jgi:hypothetical protein
MSAIDKMWKDYGIGGLFVGLLVIYGLYMLYNYFNGMGYSGSEGNQSMQAQYKPDNSLMGGAYGMFDDVQSGGVASNPNSTENASAAGGIQNPAELLPANSNSEWASLAPSSQLNGVDFLQNVNIDTIGTSRKNPLLDPFCRGQPEIPNVGVPYSQSTIDK